MLVDGGPDPDRLLVALDARVPPWDRRIDLVVLTHPHEDHVAGLPLVLERYRVGQVVEPGHARAGAPATRRSRRSSRRAARRAGRLAAGDRFTLDGIAFDVLWPDADRVPAEASDDGSDGQRRLDRAARLVRGPALPPDRRRRGGGRGASWSPAASRRSTSSRSPTTGAGRRRPRRWSPRHAPAWRRSRSERGTTTGTRRARSWRGSRTPGRPSSAPTRSGRSTWPSAPPASRFGPSARLRAARPRRPPRVAARTPRRGARPAGRAPV